MYAYSGYDTKGGWMAGAGISYISSFSMWSPVSINANMFGVGVDYSENGGLSGNFLGASISGSGVSFNPSVGAGPSFEFVIPQKIFGDGNSTTLTTNKDGSKNTTNSTSYQRRIHRLYSKSKFAYKYMIKRSGKTGNEVAAVYLKDGRVLVFDDRFNTVTASENRFAGENTLDVNINGVKYSTIGEVHTHPGGLGSGDNPLSISYASSENNNIGDSNVAAKYDNHISIIMDHYLYPNINIYDYIQVKYPQGWKIE